MSSYIERVEIEPAGVFYRFTQNEVDKLVNDFVKSKTGLDLDLTVDCLDESYDVYVQWDADEEVFNNLSKYGSAFDLGLHPEEDFMNRDALFESIFNSEVIGYECYFGGEYMINGKKEERQNEYVFYVS